MDLSSSSSDTDADGEETNGETRPSAALDERTSSSSSNDDDMGQTSSSSCGSVTGNTEVESALRCQESTSTDSNTNTSKTSCENTDGVQQTSHDISTQHKQTEPDSLTIKVQFLRSTSSYCLCILI